MAFRPDQVAESVKAALKRFPVEFCVFDHVTSMPSALLPVAGSLPSAGNVEFSAWWIASTLLELRFESRRLFHRS